MIRRLVLCGLVAVLFAFPALAKPRRVLVTPAAPLSVLDRAELAAAGLEIGKPVPGGKFLAKLQQGATLRDPRIQSIEDLRESHKLHKTAIREAARGKAQAEVTVIFHDDITLEDAQAAVNEAGGALADPLPVRFSYGHRLVARIPPSALNRLARDERVLTITGPSKRRRKPHNASSALLSNVTPLHTTPYALTGTDVVLSMFEVADTFEGAVQTSHPDFGGRVTTHLTSPVGYHATHVAGTIVGTGAGDPDAKGMAPAATLHEYPVGNDYDEILFAKENDLAPLGVVADNNSWGYLLGWDFFGGFWEWQELEEYYGAYDLIYSAPLDRITRGEGVLFVYSSGNDADPPTFAPGSNAVHKHYTEPGVNFCFQSSGCGGDCTPGYCEANEHLLSAPYTTVGEMASAKNVIAVGAVNQAKTIADFSSRGPARDGRVKPELVAKGVSIHSTVPTDDYGPSSGTSMAAPAVTGIAGLLAQQWRALFPADPTPAQLKTVMIAGAEDLGNAGPDYTYGFGLVDAQASADLILADAGVGYRIRTGTLTQGQTYEVEVDVDTTQDLRIVLGWSDPDIVYLGGNDIAEPALVNDLDVYVIGPGDVVTLPYVLDKNTPTAAATRATNEIDNTEVIEIEDAAPGTYTVVVTATEINDAPPQDFVLVANALIPPVAVPITLTATGSGTPAVSLTWNAAWPGATYDVYYRNGPEFELRASGLTTTAYLDNAVSANQAYLYYVVGHIPGGATETSNTDVATTMTFDLSLAAGNPILLTHVTELQSAANILRNLAGLSPMSWSAGSPSSGGPIRASHVTSLRTAIADGWTALSLPAPTFTRTLTPGVTAVLAADYIELRDALR